MGEWVGTNYLKGRGERSRSHTLRVFICDPWSLRLVAAHPA